MKTAVEYAKRAAWCAGYAAAENPTPKVRYTASPHSGAVRTFPRLQKRAGCARRGKIGKSVKERVYVAVSPIQRVPAGISESARRRNSIAARVFTVLRSSTLGGESKRQCARAGNFWRINRSTK